MISILCIFALIPFGISSKRVPFRYQKKKVMDDDFTTACDLCQNLNSALIRYVNFGYDDDQVQASILSACAVFSGKARTVCDFIADTYFPVFLHLAKEKIPASSSCIKMGYCSDLESKNN